MARKKDDGWGWLVLIGIGLVIYSRTGRGAENNSILIPDRLEDRIDLVVKALNDRYGKKWVDWGLDALTSYVQNALPQPLPRLLSVIFFVEQLSKGGGVPSTAKQEAAVRMARRG